MRVNKFFFYFVGAHIGCGMRGGGIGCIDGRTEGGAAWRRSVMDLRTERDSALSDGDPRGC